MTDEEKQNGIENNRHDHFVLYDKGDREGNRWFLKSPYYIDWHESAVKDIKSRSHKSGKGKSLWQNSQFYFRAGLCWSDINTTYIKSRLKLSSVHDVKSMSLFSSTSLVSEKYIVCILNSKFISEFIDSFLNNTQTFQINDARRIPIIVPSNNLLKEFEELFEKAFMVKNNNFRMKYL